MKKYALIFLLGLFLLPGGKAQTVTPTVINSAGGTFNVGPGIEVDYSVGETVISTQINGNTMLTQGFLQPGRLGISAIAFPTGVSCADKTDGSIRIQASISGAGSSSVSTISYVWSPANVCHAANTCSVVSGLAAGTYSVIVYLYNGNVKKDSAAINSIIVTDSNEPCQIIVYNGITPNGDGANDFFYIENIEGFPGNKVYIYNRWGLKLDEITNYDNVNNNWKGTVKHNGDVAPSGTYFYVIDLNNGTKPIKGWLELTHR